MPIYKKKELHELVGGDISAGPSDRNPVNNSEIETGPVEKPFNDTSPYEKGQSTTTDRVTGRYRQNIPWFAVYSYGGRRSGGAITTENKKNKTITKKTVEEKIEDLVKKAKDRDVNEKDYNPKLAKIIDTILDAELSEKQLNDLKQAIENKQAKNNI